MSCRATSRSGWTRRALPAVATRCAIPAPPTCSTAARTSGSSSSCLGTKASKPPRSTPRSASASCRTFIAAATHRDSLPLPWKTDSLRFVILLAEHDEPSLAAAQEQQEPPLKTATSTPKNRVWGFENYPSGRISAEPPLSWENAAGSVQYSYENTSGRAYYYTRDHLGSVREMLNSSGTIVARYGYDAYGAPLPGYSTNLISGTNLATFQYTHSYMHQPSGLNLLWFRAYDSNTGRWLARDP